MTVDIRASVTCSLGTLISASISDDYIQGTGLIKCKGSCELSGIYTPAVGTVVTFSYTKDSVTRTVPRKLRVLSSFADPFRRTTRVELGCKLTYLQDVKERINWDALDDPENTGITEADSKIVTIPIHAQSIATECCSKLGITTSGLALTNKFSIEEFDFSAGFVSILSDLLVSECYCGYMDESEVLQIFSLSVTGGTGPVLDSSKLIDLGQIGVGDLPGDAVVVNYNSLKLKVPDDEEVVCRLATDDSNESSWGADQSFTSTPSSATFAYKVDGEDPLLFRTFKWLDTSAETNYYAEFDVLDPDDPNAPPQKRKLLTSRVIRIGSSAAAIGGGYITERLTNGYGFGNYGVSKDSREEFQYDQYGNETYRELTTKGNLLYLYGGAGINFVYVDDNGNKSIVEINSQTLVPLEKISVSTNRYGNIVKTVTKRYGPWAETIAGQQSIATARDAIDTASSAAAYLGSAYGDLYLLDVTTEINISGSTAGQEIPSEGEVLTGSLAEDSGDPDNGFTTYSSSELELALGSATATRRIELSMPYAPDDTFYRVTVSTSPLRYCFYSRKSDAPAKAAAYGRAQNRLLLGNRNGMNIQTSPELLPAAPFSPVIVQANGLSALYRANASSWTMDSNGIVISSDMLFWGAVGGTGTFWFPVAPGVTALPTTPPVVGGEMTVSQVVLPYNEIVKVTAQLRTKLEVTSFDYPLTALTAVDPYGIRLQQLVQSSQAFISVPSIAVTLAAEAPAVAGGGSAFVPVTDIATAAPALTVSSGGSVAVPLTDLTFTVQPVAYVGPQATVIQPPFGSAGVLTALVPAVSSGVSIAPPASDIAAAASIPIVSTDVPPVLSIPGSVSASGASIVPTFTNVQTNDILLLVVETSGDGSNVTPSVEYPDWNVLTGTPLFDGNSTPAFGSKLHVWWYRATAPISSGSVVFSDSGDHQVGRVYLIRGCATTGDPFDVIGTATKPTPSTSASAPSVTTTVPQTLVVSIVSQPADGTTPQFGAPSNTGLTSLTDVDEVATNSANGGGFVIASGIKRVPGATGTINYSTTLSLSNASVVIAFKP